jgi:hypothetical protein
MLRPRNASPLFRGPGALPVRLFFFPGVVDSHPPEIQQGPQSEHPDNDERRTAQAEFQIEQLNRIARQGPPCQQPEQGVGCYRQRELSIDAQPLSPRPSTLPGPKSFWCTGKDSNLRTSQGGADLQSAGFNHSPTCAKTPSLRSFPSGSGELRRDSLRGGHVATGCPQNTKTACARKPVAQNTTFGKIPYGVLWEKSVVPICTAQLLCVPEPMLELAKGFEPLTL